MHVFAAASGGRAKMPGGISGARTIRSTTTKNPISTTPAASAPIVSGASQPDCAARLTAKTRASTPAVTVTAPTRSGRSRSWPARRPDAMTTCGWEATGKVMERYPGDPARQLLGIVEMVRDDVSAKSYFGCVYHNTSAEFRDPQHPGHQESVQHAREIRKQLRDLARVAGVDNPHELADQLLLIIDGIYASGSVLGPSGPARTGVQLAAELIRQHCAHDTGHRTERGRPAVTQAPAR
jgi:hypothetical protein